MYDTVIIGAGPAGLTAAIYLLRANKNILILEKDSYGGAIINAMDIENYPANMHITGFDFASNLYHQVQELGGKIAFEEALSIKNGKTKKVLTNKNEYKARSIIIASGTINRKLEVSGEKKFIGNGLSYCATCDGNFYKNKDVLVVGGGNSAIEDALYLSNIARKVYLVHRRNSFRADRKTLDLLRKKDNVEFILNSTVTSLYGNDCLEAVGITTSCETKKINVDGIFVAIGHIPSTNNFKDIISLDGDGYVKSHDTKTNSAGIYAAGDVRSKELRQLVTATSDGAIAANKVIKYLDNK